MHLSYKRSLLTRSAPGAALVGLFFLISAIWPSARYAGSPVQILFALCAPVCFYGAYIFYRLARGGPALTAALDGLRVNTSRGQRHFTWQEIASIGRASRVLYGKKRVELAVIEIALRELGRKPVTVSIGALNEGEAGADRWIKEANRRLDMAAPMATYGRAASLA